MLFGKPTPGSKEERKGERGRVEKRKAMREQEERAGRAAIFNLQFSGFISASKFVLPSLGKQYG